VKTRSLRPLAIAVALGLLASPWSCWPGSPRAARPTAGTTVIAFGDSLVAGRGAPAGRDFVAVLSERLGVPIINAGHSGDTTRAALARLDSDVLARDPRIAIVLLGGNDYLRRVPIEETFANLTTIVDEIRRRGAAVVLVGVSVGLLSDPYAPQYESLARQTTAALVPDILGGIIGHGNLMSDTIHPNEQGYGIMADRLEPVLRELLFEE
jgi:lysophospholipase L1-like esterase